MKDNIWFNIHNKWHPGNQPIDRRMKKDRRQKDRRQMSERRQIERRLI